MSDMDAKARLSATHDHLVTLREAPRWRMQRGNDEAKVSAVNSTSRAKTAPTRRMKDRAADPQEARRTTRETGMLHPRGNG